MTDSPPSLFDEARSPKADGRRRIVHLTNRYNLLEILSSGVLAPRSAYSKYYVDLLDAAPGRVPLLAGPLPHDSLARVQQDSATAFPVALEIDPTRLADSSVPALLRDGSTEPRRLDADEAAAWAPAGPIPLSAVAAVVFRSEGELAEHSARRYENVRDSDLLRVDASLFATPSDVRVVEWLESLPEPVAPGIDGDRADRISGALTLAAAELPMDRASFDGFAELLARRVGKPRRRARRDGGLPSWLEWLEDPNRRGGDTEARLFAASLASLLGEDRAERWRPLEVLDEVRGAVLKGRLPAEQRETLEREFDVIAAVLRNERDFPRFRPETGHAVAKALFLVLMRPEPERLLEWPSEETGADGFVRLTAAALAGALRGRKRLQLAFRPQTLDSFLASQEAALLAPAEESLVAIAPPSPVVEEEFVEGRARVRLKVGDAVLVEKVGEAAAATTALSAEDLETPGPVRDFAVEICRRLGWDDCVRTVIRGTTGEIKFDRSDSVVTFEIQGVVVPTFELDAALFCARFEAEDLPPELADELRDRLAAVSPSPRAR